MSSNNNFPPYKLASGPSTSVANHVREQSNVDLKQKKIVEVTVDKNGKQLVSFIIYVQEALSAVVGTILEGSGPLTGAVRLNSDALTHVRSVVLTVISSNSL